MSFIESAGRFASSWAKFGVTLVALGWFGLETLDRVVPRATRGPSAVIASPIVDSQVVRASGDDDATRSGNNPEPILEDRSALRAITQELSTNLLRIGDNRGLQLLVALISGLVTGLVGRPGVDRFVRWRRVQAAKRRVRLFEQDQLLLASVPPPQRQVVPTTDGASPPPAVTSEAARELAPRFPAV